MKTDDLLDLLARNAGPAPEAAVARRFVPVLLLGLLASSVLALWRFGPIPTPMWADIAPWLKLGYTLALAAAGWLLVERLARPGARPAAGVRTLAGVLLAMAALAAATLLATPAEQRMRDWMGHSWSSCPWNVAWISVPALALALWALRGLAPTRPRAAGAAAGLLSGALGAAGYSLVCTELAASFVATWYTLGIVGVVALGALLGPRLLRW
jgi:hypothetical protein